MYYYYCKTSTKKTNTKRKLETNGKEEEVLSEKKAKFNGKLGSTSKVSTSCGKSTNGRGLLSGAPSTCKLTPNGKPTPNGKATPIGKTTSTVKSNGTGANLKPKANGTASSKVVSWSEKANLLSQSSSVLTVLDKPNKATPNRTALDKTKSNSGPAVQANETKAKKKPTGLPNIPNGSDRLSNTRRSENSQADPDKKNPINKIKKVSNGLASDTNSRTSNSMNGKAVSASLNGGRAANGKQPNGKESNDLDGSKANRKRLAQQPTNPKNCKRQQVGGTKV